MIGIRRAINATSILLVLSLFPLTFLTTGCDAEAGPEAAYRPDSDSLRFTGEVHLRNIRQLTFGGNNAEAYFSFDDQKLIFQSDWSAINPQGCDQQFVMSVDGSEISDGEQYQLVSTGNGRTTCGYFLPDGRMIYASTHADSPECPAPRPSPAGVYAWPIYESFDIYITDENGENPQPIVAGPYYDAEATVSPDGRYMVFTSTRGGDLDLWLYEFETEELRQITDGRGYDGGAFFSPDSRMIVWRASRPEGEALERYQRLLTEGLVEPGELDIRVMNLDGTGERAITDLPGANWAPFFHPSGERVLFSSNHHTLSEGGRIFDIFMIGLDGTGLTQITHSGTFDSFPMFSFDGSKLVFSSNRNIERRPTRDTNVFVADWVDAPEDADHNFSTIETRATEMRPTETRSNGTAP
jgi:TolB protein